jgi:hypothetical protein
MNENPSESPETFNTRSNRNALRFRLGWWILALASIASGLGVWQIRWGIPGVHPAFGGPGPARVVVVLAIAALGYVVFATAIIVRAMCIRSMRFGLCAIVPLSFIVATLVEFATAVP